MRSLYQNDGKELLNLFQTAKSAGVTTSLDMSSIDPTSEAGQISWERILSKCMPFVDFFMPSSEELGFMLDRALFAQWIERANGDDIVRSLNVDTDVRPLADRLMAMGARMLLIKCGVAGIYYRTANSPAMQALCTRYKLNSEDWLGKEGFEASYYQPNIVSATGAGDTCIAAFIAALLKGKSLDRCIKLAAAAGACCVAAHDALSGLLPLEELESRIDAGWSKGILSC
jgi:sugar/nucleoside kinase (ribokinase family)